MSPSRALASLAATTVAALVAVATAVGLQQPGRTLVRSGPVRLVALNHASIAYVVGRSAKDCDHVELWNVDTKGTWRFGRPGPCTNLGSTGTGISAVSVSGNRAVWIRYTGGNLRDWQLMTATTTSPLPRQLRFVEQDVELPSPLALGDSTGGLGIPYAAGHEVVLLGASGKAVFTHDDRAAVTAVAAGHGPGAAVVAALRETGEVAMLRSSGSVAWKAVYPAGSVKALALAPAGLVVQVGSTVEIRGPAGVTKSVALPAGARMTDYAEGRILYTLGRDVRALRAATGSTTRLLHGTGTTAPPATLDTHGLAWGRGNAVAFACAGCIAFTS